MHTSILTSYTFLDGLKITHISTYYLTLTETNHKSPFRGKGVVVGARKHKSLPGAKLFNGRRCKY